MPAKPFGCVSHIACKVDKGSRSQVGDRRFCSTDLALRGRVLTVSLRADAAGAYDEEGGVFVYRHRHRYGSAPTDSTDPASQLAPLLAVSAGHGRTVGSGTRSPTSFASTWTPSTRTGSARRSG